MVQQSRDIPSRRWYKHTSHISRPTSGKIRDVCILYCIVQLSRALLYVVYTRNVLFEVHLVAWFGATLGIRRPPISVTEYVTVWLMSYREFHPFLFQLQGMLQPLNELRVLNYAERRGKGKSKEWHARIFFKEYLLARPWLTHLETL